MKKTLIIFLILIIAVTSISIATDDIGIKERELKELENELKKVDSEIKNVKSEEYSIINSINGIENNIRKFDAEIEALNSEISNTVLLIEETEKELDDKSQYVKEKKEILKDRVRVMYKSGNVGYLEVLLGAKNFKDLLTRIDMVQKIIDHDKKLIKTVQSKILEIEEIEASLIMKKKKLNNTKKEVKIKKEYLGNQYANLNIQKVELRQNRKALEALSDKLLKDADKVTEIIKNLKTKAKYVGGKMTWPAPSTYKVTSPFGYRMHPVLHKRKLHTGTDIATAWGSNIVAAQSGTIIYANWLGGYGKAVMIDHGGGYVTLYAHLSSWTVKIGQNVKRGQLIAKSGNTGISTGPHLHFEVRVNGEYVDPMKYLKN